MEGTGTPDYGKCVDLSTQAALKEMMLPGAMTILFPLIIGLVPLLLGAEAAWAAETLGGYMAGVTVSGVLWAIFQNNRGRCVGQRQEVPSKPAWKSTEK